MAVDNTPGRSIPGTPATRRTGASSTPTDQVLCSGATGWRRHKIHPAMQAWMPLSITRRASSTSSSPLALPADGSSPAAACASSSTSTARRAIHHAFASARPRGSQNGLGLGLCVPRQHVAERPNSVLTAPAPARPRWRDAPAPARKPICKAPSRWTATWSAASMTLLLLQGTAPTPAARDLGIQPLGGRNRIAKSVVCGGSRYLSAMGGPPAERATRARGRPRQPPGRPFMAHRANVRSPRWETWRRSAATTDRRCPIVRQADRVVDDLTAAPGRVATWAAY